ncbi:uncharacterized protein BDZ99DRAFT_457878 [Mytilinidion resinicola]|uniref:Uncharacterized protein n=1 Tax=Mytilinidion resinicola TaxID=574789 RepID=A0A6A6Z532_9PEZI|nr:uncharacterized protein BDZ99DRAFT_457878 [Mytilinidion resinicola]KAF2815938.1 hypothetical protein BDZ99DRAFT_457878 [Mytilinidion resinicola]
MAWWTRSLATNCIWPCCHGLLSFCLEGVRCSSGMKIEMPEWAMAGFFPTLSTTGTNAIYDGVAGDQFSPCHTYYGVCIIKAELFDGVLDPERKVARAMGCSVQLPL